jgi:hypothetical protein
VCVCEASSSLLLHTFHRLFFDAMAASASASASASSLPSLQTRAAEEIADRLSLLPDLALPFSLSGPGRSAISQADKKAHLLDLLHREAAIFLGTFTPSENHHHPLLSETEVAFLSSYWPIRFQVDNLLAFLP